MAGCNSHVGPETPEAGAPPHGKTNVLFLVVDDLRPELGCYGRNDIVSPHIDRLAAGGLQFTHAYCQQTTCNASRASMLLGMRPDSTGVEGNKQHFRDTVGREVVTLAEHFKNNGYQSVGLGKVFHGRLNDDRSWSTFNPCVLKHWVRPENLELIRKNVEAARARGAAGNGKVFANFGPAYEWCDLPDEEYPDGLMVNEAQQQLRRLKDKPFFLAVGFRKPHLPFAAPKKYWDLYDPQTIQPSPITDWPRGAPQRAQTDSNELRHYEGMPKEGNLPPAEAVNLIHGYRACVSFVDAGIGRILDELDRLGLAENTIVILWGDHGFKLSEYSAWCKHTNYEIDTHVPLMIRVPGRTTPGTKTPALVELIDIYPTLCELTGLPLPEQLEGTSFAPLLELPDRPWKQAAFSQFPRGQYMGYAMRTPQYRIVRWVRPDRADQDASVLELYDHEQDPHETVNLAVDPEYATLVRQLEAQWKAGRKAAGPDEVTSSDAVRDPQDHPTSDPQAPPVSSAMTVSTE